MPEGTNWLIQVECDKGTIGEWDYDNWQLITSNLKNTRTKCKLIFRSSEYPLINYGISEKKVETGSGLYEIRHKDAIITSELNDDQKNNLRKVEYRYAGLSPNNYVTFNSELWRIIGLVNTPEGQRIKIIRDAHIGTYSWDTRTTAGNGGNGINEWSIARIMSLLNNGVYYNRTSGTCFSDINNGTKACNFKNNGLTDEAKEMIDTVTWNIGSKDGDVSDNILNVTTMYSYERSNKNGDFCSSGEFCTDTTPRTTIWSGQVGLMYPSDYGYATAGGSTIDRKTCFETSMYQWNGKKDCYQNNWLFNSLEQWTITPRRASIYKTSVFRINNNGNLNNAHAYNAITVRPTVYLKSNIKIASGTGTKDLPYSLIKTID